MFGRTIRPVRVYLINGDICHGGYLPDPLKVLAHSQLDTDLFDLPKYIGIRVVPRYAINITSW